jgi:hypothetical protein
MIRAICRTSQEMMKKQSQKKYCERKGENLILPIVGDIASEIVLSMRQQPCLIFRDTDGNESQISFEESILLSRDGRDAELTGSKPGVTFNPRSLSPLVELLGSEVTEAIAYREGALWISFSSRHALNVVPNSGYEAWHFQYPRPGRPIGGKLEHFVSVTGADGRLIG